MTTILPTHGSGGSVVLFPPFPWTVKVAEHCQQQLKLEGLSCQWQSREEKCESLSLCACVSVLAPDALAQSSMTQLLTTPHFAGINGGPAGGRLTASNERRTLQSSQTRKRRVFASSLNLLLCCMLSETVLYVHFFPMSWTAAAQVVHNKMNRRIGTCDARNAKQR